MKHNVYKGFQWFRIVNISAISIDGRASSVIEVRTLLGFTKSTALTKKSGQDHYPLLSDLLPGVLTQCGLMTSHGVLDATHDFHVCVSGSVATWQKIASWYIVYPSHILWDLLPYKMRDDYNIKRHAYSLPLCHMNMVTSSLRSAFRNPHKGSVIRSKMLNRRWGC